MSQEPDHDDGESRESGGGINLELILSYLAFARNAIAKRKVLIVVVALMGLALTITLAVYLPRSYVCQTQMVTVNSGVLEGDRGSDPLAGAESLIMSHDNLEKIVNEIGLKKKFVERRPPLLALKDQMIQSVFGPMDDKVLSAVLIGTLGNQLDVTSEKDTLTIDVTWSDGQTAADIAQATREGFLRIRHTAEMSAFQDKMAILDSHAIALRAEIGVLAQQAKEALAAKRAELTAQAEKSAGGRAPVTAIRRSLTARPSGKAAVDELLPDLRTRVATLKQELASAENARSERIRSERAKLDELKLRLTPSHPQVITQQERVDIASQMSSELMQMRSEVQDLESQVRQREAMQSQARNPTSAFSTTTGDSPASEALPTEILGLLDERDADPALAAQISGAVTRYGSLRDDIRGAKLALDTAQAAFTRRYKVTVPVEAPNTPIKPKKAVVIGAGLALSLLLAFLLPILLEIKRDVVSERWQVNQLQLPVLAELRLPPRNGAS